MPNPDLVLVSHHLCPCVQRARIVLAEKSIDHELKVIDLANKPAWFTRISPLGKVPVLITDGRPLFESAVIVEYLDEITPGSLHPDDPYERARNRSWTEFASATLDEVAGFYNASSDSALLNKAESLRSRFARVESVLGRGRFFVGERFSMVDAAFAPLFRYFEVIENHSKLRFFTQTPKVSRWRSALRSRPSVKGAVDDDYHERLLHFFLDRNSSLGKLIEHSPASKSMSH